MSKNILVTGGTGYIGSHTVVELIEQGFTPIILDNLGNSNSSVIAAVQEITGITPKFYHGDCRDEKIYNTIFTENEINCVVHFAAHKSVNESVENPLKYFNNNLFGLVKLLECMQQHQVQNIVFSSSCTVYGSPDEPAVTEETKLKVPSSPYGLTKRMNEEILTSVCSLEQNVRAIFLRYFNPVGAHPSALIGESPVGVPNNLFPYITQTLAGIREKLLLFGNDYSTPDGTCVRDFIHVVDLAKAHVSAIAYFNENTVFNHEIFNIGTGKGTSVLEIVKGFEKTTNQTINWAFAPRRKGDVQEIFANVDKANSVLNWKSAYTIEDAIKHAWSWEKSQIRI